VVVEEETEPMEQECPSKSTKNSKKKSKSAEEKVDSKSAKVSEFQSFNECPPMPYTIIFFS